MQCSAPVNSSLTLLNRLSAGEHSGYVTGLSTESAQICTVAWLGYDGVAEEPALSRLPTVLSAMAARVSTPSPGKASTVICNMPIRGQEM